LKTEKELIEDKLAFIRDDVFDETDFISDDGHDLLSGYVGSPYEVLCGMEQKIYRLMKINDVIKGYNAIYLNEIRVLKERLELAREQRYVIKEIASKDKVNDPFFKGYKPKMYFNIQENEKE
jgi:hypothetical protein